MILNLRPHEIDTLLTGLDLLTEEAQEDGNVMREAVLCALREDILTQARTNTVTGRIAA